MLLSYTLLAPSLTRSPGHRSTLAVWRFPPLLALQALRTGWLGRPWWARTSSSRGSSTKMSSCWAYRILSHLNPQVALWIFTYRNSWAVQPKVEQSFIVCEWTSFQLCAQKGRAWFQWGWVLCYCYVTSWSVRTFWAGKVQAARTSSHHIWDTHRLSAISTINQATIAKSFIVLSVYKQMVFMRCAMRNVTFFSGHPGLLCHSCNSLSIICTSRAKE